MRISRLIVTAVGVLGSTAALAGPYCLVVDGMGQQCRFYDEASCARAAVEQHGGCFEKGRAVSVTPKNARYCLMSAGETKCYFYDAESCAKEAKLSGGTCLTRPSKSS